MTSLRNTLFFTAVFLLGVSLFSHVSADTSIVPTTPTQLSVEFLTASSSSVSFPNFSATYTDPNTNDVATKYQIQVASSTNFGTTLWDSKVTVLANQTPQGSQITPVSYAGPALAPGTYYWRIRFFDSTNKASPWSAKSKFFLKPPPPLALDGYTAPLVAYGVRQLLSNYKGKALQLTRVSDSVAIDVSFLPDGSLDASSADAFCINTQCKITVWYDQSGGGHNATAPLENAPMWDATKTIKGTRAISFQSTKQDMSTYGGLPIRNQYLSIPAEVSYNPADSSVLMVAALNDTATRGDEGGLFSNATGAYGFTQSFNDAQGVHGVGFGGTMHTHLTTTPSAFMITVAPTFFKLYINGTYEKTTHPNTTGQSAGGYIGYDAVNGGAIMSLGAFVLWGSQITVTPTQPQPTILAPIESAFSLEKQAKNIVTIVGASDGAGLSSETGSSWPFRLEAQLPAGTRIFNSSSSGMIIPLSYTERFNMLGDVYAKSGGAEATNFVVVYTIIGNDIRSGSTLATIKTGLQNYVAYAKSLGANVKVVVTTKELDCSFQNNAKRLPVLRAYNDWIRSSYNVPIANGGVGADAYVDRMANTSVQNGGYETSPMCDPTISYDGVHLRDPYQATVTPFYANAIKTLF